MPLSRSGMAGTNDSIMATKKKSASLGAKPVYKNSASLLPWFGIALLVILFDQVTKITVERSFAYGETLPMTSLPWAKSLTRLTASTARMRESFRYTTLNRRSSGRPASRPWRRGTGTRSSCR